jgi:hypothetical protein
MADRDLSEMFHQFQLHEGTIDYTAIDLLPLQLDSQFPKVPSSVDVVETQPDGIPFIALQLGANVLDNRRDYTG